jgi:hypothetical protein
MYVVRGDVPDDTKPNNEVFRDRLAAKEWFDDVKSRVPEEFAAAFLFEVPVNDGPGAVAVALEAVQADNTTLLDRDDWPEQKKRREETPNDPILDAIIEKAMREARAEELRKVRAKAEREAYRRNAG